MQTISSGLGRLGVGLALVFFWASAPAEATTITNVTVSIGTYTYNPGTCAATATSNCTGWSFPPVILSTGQDLVLTQDFQGPPNDSSSYNFDTSDEPDLINPTLLPQITITADGVTTTFTDTLQVLNVKSQGSVGFDLNEAQSYGAALSGPAGLSYQVFLGYADNVHPGVCGAYATSLGLLGSSTCFPSPFSTATVFEGTGAFVPAGLTEPNDGFHCGSGPTCYDAGVIRIVSTASQVPEPATVTLLLTGLMVLTARRFGQARKRAAGKHSGA